MLRRQKIILAMLAQSRQPLQQTVLVKLAFLLRHETVLEADPAFYDFLPYRYGPFSFALYRELDRLVRDDVVTAAGERYALGKGKTAISESVASLPAKVHSAIRSIWGAYGHLGHNRLLRDVYERYPWYATQTDRVDLRPAELPPRDPASPAVYTAGYEGKSVDRFFDDLLRAGIRVIIDVRANPVSRKYGFAASSLRSIAERLHIEYSPFPRLGIPSTERAELNSRDAYECLFRRYEQEWLPNRKVEVDRAARLMTSKPCALVCMERDPRSCHRSRLASAVARINGLPVTHLD